MAEPKTELMEQVSSSHPQPGPRPARSIWVGGEGPAPREATNTDARPFATETHDQFTEVSPNYRGRHNAKRRKKKRTMKENVPQKRLRGVDVARGIAFIGMVVIHTLPSYDRTTGEPTAAWSFFSGNASALFALLAGVSLAFMTGGSNPYHGDKRVRALISIATRSIILIVVGMSINMIGEATGVYNILPYYGLLFFIAIPLTMLPVLGLIVIAIICIAAGPFAVYHAYQAGFEPLTGNPTLTDLMASPGDVAMILTLTGTYPAVTWAAYVCLGIAIGRLSLHRERTQLAVMITGLVVAVLSKIATYILLIRQDGLQHIMDATEGLTREELRSYQIFGAESYFPTTTYWWLALDAPHTNTAFSIAFGAGLAMFVLGLVLILSKYIMSWLGVFAAMGTMTLTLYSAHLVFVNLINVRENYVIYFIAQIVVAAVFAMAWAKIRGTGPLEFLVSKSSKAVGAAFVPERKERVDRA